MRARDHEAHLAHWKKILNDKTIVTRTILADGEVAGNAVSWSQDGHREIGYWIGRSFWGRGWRLPPSANSSKSSTSDRTMRGSRGTMRHPSACWKGSYRVRLSVADAWKRAWTPPRKRLPHPPVAEAAGGPGNCLPRAAPHARHRSSAGSLLLHPATRSHDQARGTLPAGPRLITPPHPPRQEG
jgi:hypothetical protein